MTNIAQYIEFGMDNVFLFGGNELKCDDEGDFCFTTSHGNLLNERLMQVLVVQAPYLNGAQARWLRSELGLTPAQMATLLNVAKDDLIEVEQAEHGRLAAHLDDQFRRVVVKNAVMFDELPDQSHAWNIEDDAPPYVVEMHYEDDNWQGSITFMG